MLKNKINREERAIRLLTIFYNDLVGRCKSDGELSVDSIGLLDATQDVIGNDEDNMIEWTITKNLQIKWK